MQTQQDTADDSIGTHADNIVKSLTVHDPERQRQYAESETRLRVHQFDQFLSDAGIPKRHMRCGELNTAGAWGKTLAFITGALGKGIVYALVGPRGTGKTQLAVELIRASFGKRSCLYMTTFEFFMTVKDAYRKDSKESELDVLSRLREPKLLVLDEFGKRSEKEWEDRLLFELLNERYGDMTDTILLSNQEPAEFQTALGPSLTDRVREVGGIINCTWDSFRK
jgi:chromosomal replication initiation ATPase DnaA